MAKPPLARSGASGSRLIGKGNAGTLPRLPALTLAKRIVFYCAFGERSAMAVQAAHDAGLSSACHIQGGLDAWTKADGPLCASLTGDECCCHPGQLAKRTDPGSQVPRGISRKEVSCRLLSSHRTLRIHRKLWNSVSRPTAARCVRKTADIDSCLDPSSGFGSSPFREISYRIATLRRTALGRRGPHRAERKAFNMQSQGDEWSPRAHFYLCRATRRCPEGTRRAWRPAEKLQWRE
jgi:Rhodanese-like domain